ncbi:glycoside hydrolase family 125 protein [Clostridium sp. HCS.1]|uniref:glycoside hydrolase family 125 protein n=1 Tax=Clostridium sp. HCS.1 TaxID=3238594 RepID=UPI003A100412
MEKYRVTGNEFISLPTIKESNGGIEGISFLHMGAKGMLEIMGNKELSLLEPTISINGIPVPIEGLTWEYINYWIPCFKMETDELIVEGTLLAPINERGFCYHLALQNKTPNNAEIKIGLKGCWSKAYHSINESKEIDLKKFVYESGWNNSFVLDMRNGYSLFAFAPILTELQEQSDISYEYKEKNNEIIYEIIKEDIISAGGKIEQDFWFGIGFEEVSATTSAKEMLRQGYNYEYEKTKNWLKKRIKTTKNEKLDYLLNLNMFFSYFFASGITIDTEDLTLMTSRSPRYYVSAAYWDRDSLLWSFPAILMADVKQARKMLIYVFEKQIRNVGIHSRYIDGTVLEPGFELDELCAPIIALYNYFEKTSDNTILHESCVEKGVKRILEILEEKKNETIGLYETMLQPTDDMIVYPYLTYNNALVWKILNDISHMYKDIWSEKEINKLKLESSKVKNSIFTHCVKEKDGKDIFAWSIDENDNWDIYDEPPGSLLLLPYYGFCNMNDEIWKNTVDIIKRKDYPYSFAECPISDIGCKHAPHPWILSIANSLLCGDKEKAKENLSKCIMDNGIACESVDEYTGECATGEAFATCAGFLAYAINYAFGE